MAGQFVVENRGTLATIGAAATCLSGVATAVCGVVTAAAFAVRAQQRADEQGGFSQALPENLADGALTLATFGLVSWPASLAESGGALAVRGTSPMIIKGMPANSPLWQLRSLRLGAATPDFAGLLAEPFLGGC
jgi:hypothetical protein